jgi:hypothetical protein
VVTTTSSAHRNVACETASDASQGSSDPIRNGVASATDRSGRQSRSRAVVVVAGRVVGVPVEPTVAVLARSACRAAHPDAAIATATMTTNSLVSLVHTRKGYRDTDSGVSFLARAVSHADTYGLASGKRH